MASSPETRADAEDSASMANQTTDAARPQTATVKPVQPTLPTRAETAENPQDRAAAASPSPDRTKAKEKASKKDADGDARPDDVADEKEHGSEGKERGDAEGRHGDSNDSNDSDGGGDDQSSDSGSDSGSDPGSDPGSGTGSGDALPPLPDEPLPDAEDDGWDPMWSDEHRAWYFFNRFTHQTQWENPRVPAAGSNNNAGRATGGYNPAIHGDYDPSAWYAQGAATADAVDAEEGVGISAIAAAHGLDEDAAIEAAAEAAAQVLQQQLQQQDYSHKRGGGGRGSGRGQGHDSHGASDSGAAETRRPPAIGVGTAYYDVDAAAGANQGRSLKAERSGKRPSRSELKAFRERRKARKEEKRRAWLRD